MSEKEKKNIPEVRFDGFDEEWEKKKLSDVSTIKKGEQLNKENMVENGQYPVMNGGVEPSGMTDQPNTPSETISISEGGNSCGFVKLNHTEFWSGGHNYTVNNPSLDNDFLYQSLKSQQNDIMNLREGTGLPNIQKGKIENINIDATSIVEQKKIAEFFKQLDKLIELNEKKVEKLEALKKSLLYKMFPGGGAATPQIRFGGFGDGWKTITLSNVATFFRGHGYSKNDLTDDGTPIVLYGRLYTKYETEITEVDTFVVPKDNSVYSTGREVLVPSSGETAEDIARASHISQNNVLLGGDLNVLLPNSDVDSNFLAFSISNGHPQKELSKKAQGKSVVHIHNEDIQTLDVPFPKMNEQVLISQLLLNAIQEINTYTQKIEKFRNVKIALLNKMIPHTHTHTQIPQIRFKEFVHDWKCVELGDLCSITTGSLDANAAIVDGEYAFFTCDKNPSRTNSFAFDGDAILVAGNGNVGHTNLYSGKFNAYQRTYVLMDFTENFLFTKLIIDRNLPEKLTKEIFGGCIPYIKLDTLQKLKVMLP